MFFDIKAVRGSMEFYRSSLKANRVRSAGWVGTGVRIGRSVLAVAQGPVVN